MAKIHKLSPAFVTLNDGINNQISQIVRANGCPASVDALLDIKNGILLMVATRVPGSVQVVEVKPPCKKSKIVGSSTTTVPTSSIDDKLLVGLGKKFGRKSFTEEEFIHAGMELLKEEAKTS